MRPSSGKGAVVGILTREEADEEVKGYKNQVANLKRELNDAKRSLESKDKEVGELRQQSRWYHIFPLAPHLRLNHSQRYQN